MCVCVLFHTKLTRSERQVCLWPDVVPEDKNTPDTMPLSDKTTTDQAYCRSPWCS
jgi:hypothetical protein